ncbi:MAG: hypothetical protein ACE5ER_09120 [Nitrospinaceae bacterium]
MPPRRSARLRLGTFLILAALGLTLLAPGFLISPGWAAAPPAKPLIPKTGDPAWDGFVALQTRWLRQLHDLILNQRPDFKGIADLSLRWRTEQMRLDTLKFRFLLSHHAAAIQRDKGLPAFLRLEWFPDYTAALEKSGPIFARQEKKAGALKEKVKTHPQWQALQDYLKELQKSPEHKPQFDRFIAEMNKVQKILARTAAEEMRTRQ